MYLLTSYAPQLARIDLIEFIYWRARSLTTFRVVPPRSS